MVKVELSESPPVLFKRCKLSLFLAGFGVQVENVYVIIFPLLEGPYLKVCTVTKIYFATK